MAQTGKLEAAAGAWDDAGVRWVLLRGKATLAHPQSDVDLLVAAEDMDAFEVVVHQHGGAAYPRWAHPRARRFRVGELELDVVTELAYGHRRSVKSGLENGCLERRVRDGWLWQLAPTDAFWTVLLHCLLDKNTITERRALELQATAGQVARNGPAESFTARVLPTQWPPDRLLELVKTGRWEDLEVLGRQLRTPAGRGTTALHRAGGWTRAVAAGLAMRASRRVTSRSVTAPATIAFSGLDGAGKTLLIRALIDDLGPGANIETVWVPFEVWPAGMVNRLLPATLRSRLGPARRALDGRDAQPAAPQPNQRVRALARTTAWTPVACAAAVSAGLGLRRRAAAPRGDLVILDRYRLDTIVKLHYWYSEVPPGLLSRIVLLLAPCPSVEFVVRVPPDVAYARKAEQWSVRQLTRQARSYDIAAAHARAVVLDGCQSPECLAAQVLDHVRSRVGEAPRG